MAIPELTDASERLTDCIYFGDPISSNVGSGFVPTARTVSTTLPLTGGGDFSANRTLAINNFAGSVAGAVPPSTGGVVTFLRADGSWATPPTFGAAAVGYAPASGGGAVNFLRADGTWAPPAGTGISGLTVDRVPVATSATAIGDGRLLQIVGGHQAFSSEAGSAYKSVKVTEDAVNSKVIVQPDWYNGFTALDADLSLRGVSGFVGTDAELLVGPTRISLVGQVTLPQKTITVANGANGAIDPDSSTPRSWIRLIGPTASFSVGGFLYGIDGVMLVVNNTTMQAWTIKNEDAAVVASARILTQTGGDLVFPANLATATFIYSGTDSRWLLVASSPSVQYPRTLGYVPYQDSGGNLADSTLFHDSANNRYGFATATPAATVDVNGTLATRSYNQTLSNGLNSNLPAPTTSYSRITGPTGAFSVGGVSIVTGENGKRLTIHNTTAQAMTIVHEDASSTAAHRINTLTGANVVYPARQSVVHLVYSTTTSRWILDEAQPNAVGGATTQVQYNLAGSPAGTDGLVVTGTGTSTALTLGTDAPLTRKATGHLELGVPAATTTAKKVTGHSSRGGTDSNVVGGKFSVGGGAGTGTGGGGDTALITAYPGVLGNTQNTYADRLVYLAAPVALTDSAATSVAYATVATEGYAGGTLWVTVCATDGTDMQIRRMRVEWGAVNKASTITVVFGTPEEVDCTPVGTLTATITALDNGDNSFDFQVTPVSSLTTTVFEAWVSAQHDGRGTVERM